MKERTELIISGIKVKLKRGGKLDEILASYTKLSDEEKDYIREKLKGGGRGEQ